MWSEIVWFLKFMSQILRLDCFSDFKKHIRVLLNWINLRFRCGCTPVPVTWNFVVYLPYCAIFKNVVHSLEPGETPSNSASHQAHKLCATLLNIAKYFKTVRCGCGAVAVRLRLFFNLLMFSTVLYLSIILQSLHIEWVYPWFGNNWKIMPWECIDK